MNKKYNLTTPQKSIYLIEQYYSNTNINNICGTAVIEQKINLIRIPYWDFDNIEQILDESLFI